jgi:DNA-binding GntR family transcriptional regulator
MSTAKNAVQEFLKENGSSFFIEIHQCLSTLGHSRTAVSSALRELENEGKVTAEYKQVPKVDELEEILFTVRRYTLNG